MNIDERLDRLAHRHEALAQSIELLTADIHELSQSVKKHESYIGQIMEGTARLLHVAEIHEHRIQRLEDQQE